MEKVEKGKADALSTSSTPTKYAVSDASPIEGAATPTKYAVSEASPMEGASTPTKYAVSDSSVAGYDLLERRRLLDLAIEELLHSAVSAVKRSLPDASADSHARIVVALVDKFGDRLLQSNLAVVSTVDNGDE